MIGKLKEGEFGLEGLADFPLFQKQITVYIDKDAPIEYAEKCADYLALLDNNVIDKFCEASIRYCEDNREYFEDEQIDIPENISLRDILRYIDPINLSIEKPESGSIAFHMELNCDWEPEHGLEWTINDGDVLYVGAFHSESPWQSKEYFKEAGWNYAIINT